MAAGQGKSILARGKKEFYNERPQWQDRGADGSDGRPWTLPGRAPREERRFAYHHCSKNEDKGRKVIREIGSGSLFMADLGSLASIESVADLIATKHGRIDILINNAGVLKRRLEMSPDGYEMTMMVNHIAVAALTLRLLPQLLAAGPGARIINTNSADIDLTPARSTSL